MARMKTETLAHATSRRRCSRCIGPRRNGLLDPRVRSQLLYGWRVVLAACPDVRAGFGSLFVYTFRRDSHPLITISEDTGGPSLPSAMKAVTNCVDVLPDRLLPRLLGHAEKHNRVMRAWAYARYHF